MILDHERLIYYMNQMKVASYHTTWSVSKNCLYQSCINWHCGSTFTSGKNEIIESNTLTQVITMGELLIHAFSFQA